MKKKTRLHAPQTSTQPEGGRRHRDRRCSTAARPQQSEPYAAGSLTKCIEACSHPDQDTLHINTLYAADADLGPACRLKVKKLEVRFDLACVFPCEAPNARGDSLKRNGTKHGVRAADTYEKRKKNEKKTATTSLGQGNPLISFPVKPLSSPSCSRSLRHSAATHDPPLPRHSRRATPSERCGEIPRRQENHSRLVFFSPCRWCSSRVAAPAVATGKRPPA